MFAKRTRHKIQFNVHVESIEQIPNSYINLGSVKIAYAKGKLKGETTAVPCTSQNVTLGETLKWTAKFSKDEKTGSFESKVLEFKLRHVSQDGHKEKTLGTADVDLAQLCRTPKATTRLGLQFAAKGQGRLKTKATLIVQAIWIKIGDKPFQHEADPQISPLDDTTPGNEEDQFFTAVTIMTTPFLSTDATLSELSDSTTLDGDEDDESNVIFESTDFDQATENGAPLASIQSQSASNLLSPAPQSNSGNVTLNSVTPSHIDADAASVTSTSSKSSKRHMQKRSSDPSMRSMISLPPTRAANNDLAPNDPRMYSASMSVLPEFDVSSASTQSSLAPAPRPRARTKSSTYSMQVPANQQSSRPLSAGTNHQTIVSSGSLAGSTTYSVSSIVTSSSMNNISLNNTNLVSASASLSSLPQASIRPPIEESPFVSYVDNGAPELPESSQHTLVYLSPNAFAIQTAAISGDEIARLRAENMDKNLKISLLGKQVSVLEKKLADVSARLEEVTKREHVANSEVGQLERKLRSLRKKTKLSDSTMDESSSTSSGDAQRSNTEKKKRKKKPRDRSNSTVHLLQPRQFWTPEDERRGLIIIFAVVMLVVIFFCSPQFRSSFSYVVEYVGISPSFTTQPASISDNTSTDYINAANELTLAVASALNLTQSDGT